MTEVRNGTDPYTADPHTAETAAAHPDTGEGAAADPDTAEAAAADPDGAEPHPSLSVPKGAGIGIFGWLRWGWRQLTSMRTALVLLFLLAVASIPGSLLPLRPLNPEKVDAYADQNPALAGWLDRFSLFDVFAAPWFVAIYLLLFVSLAGCVVPRSWRHLRAIRSRPPAAPRNLSKLPQSARFRTTAAPERVIELAREELRGRRFRVDVDARGDAIAAEKGYLGETGNLAFHLALLALLFAVAGGAAFGYRGNVLVTEGDGFANTLAAYDAFQPGQAFEERRLSPFSVTVDDFKASYVSQGARRGQATDFVAKIRYRSGPGAPARPYDLRVNHPLEVDGTRIYLLGHGYAPTFTVRDRTGAVAFDGAVPFLPVDERTFASEGVIKVPDARPQQLGFVGLFLPTAAVDPAGRPLSAFPAAYDPAVSLFAFKGDLGLDSGAPQSVYRLDAAKMERIRAERRLIRPGDKMTLPDGSGSVTFTGYREWVSLQVSHDPGRAPALASGLAAIAGVVMTFLVRRRRVWVRATPAAAMAEQAAGPAAGEPAEGEPAEGEPAEGEPAGRPVEAPAAGTVVEVGGLSLGAVTGEFEEIVARLRRDPEGDPGGDPATPLGAAREGQE